MKNVLVVDDHPLIFDGLKSKSPNYNWYYACDISGANIILNTTRIDTCIIDITLGDESGLTLAFKTAKNMPTFLLTMHKQVKKIELAKANGIKGYFTKDGDLNELHKALESPNTKIFWTNIPENKTTTQVFNKLSPREQEIFILLAENQNCKQIGKMLKLKTKTVNNYKTSLQRKLGITEPIAIVKLAIELGLIEV